MKKIAVIIFFIFISLKIFSMDVYIDNKKLKNITRYICSEVKFVDDIKDAELIFYNGITNDIKKENSYDYTVGIENLLYLDKREVNEKFLYNFGNYKKIIKNITEIFKIYNPRYEESYEKRLQHEINNINNIVNQVDKNKKLILKRGSRYDYLLREFNIKYINVDKYFIYKEKAYRKYGIRKVYLFKDFEKQYVNQLQNYGYNFVEVNKDGEYPYFLIEILKEVKNG